MELGGSTQYIRGTNNKGGWVSVAIPGNVKEEEDAEEVERSITAAGSQTQ